MRIAFFGSSLVSAYWNGAATYYRGILRALAARGHEVAFFEPDAFERQAHRDIPDPPWARVVVYSGQDGAVRALEDATSADLLVKASGVGVFDAFLERAVLEQRRPGMWVAFWDVDAPATLERVQSNPGDPFRELIPRYDFIFTYGGGAPVVRRYRELGAGRCIPIYNAHDPSTHFPVPAQPRFACDLSFLGNRLPDRERRVEEFFWEPAIASPGRRFLLGGAGWQDKPLPVNARYLGHVYTADHNALNCSSLAVLNVSRECMAANGYSPATRVFEAAAAGACLITDAWEGIEQFFEPGEEILVAESGAEVAEHLASLDPARARRIGAAALRRARAEHTYERRAAQVDEALEGGGRSARTPSADLRALSREAEP